MGKPFTATERQEILKEYFAGQEDLHNLAASYDVAPAAQKAEMQIKLAAARQRQTESWKRYEDGLPRLPLSRCPFTGAVVTHSLDNFGLDGPWWNYGSPIRPADALPATFFALAGAVKLGDRIENFPFLCRPGPEVPYVVPRLLSRPEVKAVISSIPVGPHQAYAIFYFAEASPGDVRRINTWGTSEYWLVAQDGRHLWDAVGDVPADFDYGLERWLGAGKLLWIAPGDQKLTLHSDVGRCPYLNLPGRRQPLLVSRGRAGNVSL